jgi:hypothetical protein
MNKFLLSSLSLLSFSAFASPNKGSPNYEDILKKSLDSYFEQKEDPFLFENAKFGLALGAYKSTYNLELAPLATSTDVNTAIGPNLFQLDSSISFKKIKLKTPFFFGGDASFSAMLPSRNSLDINFGFLLQNTSLKTPAEVNLILSDFPYLGQTYYVGDLNVKSKLKGPLLNLDFSFTNYFSFNLAKANTQANFSLGLNLTSLDLKFKNNIGTIGGPFLLEDPSDPNPSYPIVKFNSLNNHQKQKLFGVGPMIKFTTEFDLIKRSNVHGFRFFAENKTSLLFSSFKAKGTLSTNYESLDEDRMTMQINTTNANANINYKRQKTDYIMLNYLANIGFKYDYKKDLSLWVSYKVSTYLTSSLTSGTLDSVIPLSRGLIPDITNLLIAIPYSLGFSGAEAGISWGF